MLICDTVLIHGTVLIRLVLICGVLIRGVLIPRADTPYGANTLSANTLDANTQGANTQGADTLSQYYSPIFGGTLICGVLIRGRGTIVQSLAVRGAILGGT